MIPGRIYVDCTQALADAIKEALEGHCVKVIHVLPGTYQVAKQQPEVPLIPEPQPRRQPKQKPWFRQFQRSRW